MFLTLLRRLFPGPQPAGQLKTEFYSSIAGVSHHNRDGTSRQRIIRQSVRPGDSLGFRFDDDNPVDPLAVAVFAPDGRQLGYLNTRPQGDRGLAEEVRQWVAEGCHVQLTVKEVTGGTRGKPRHGVNIIVQVYEPEPVG